jgi:paraquat-inducible protein B
MATDVEILVEGLKGQLIQINQRLETIEKKMDKMDDDSVQWMRMRDRLDTFNVQLAKCEKSLDELWMFTRKLNEQLMPRDQIATKEDLVALPMKNKVAVFDYVWKYALVGLGGVIAAKIGGLF